MTHPRDAYRLDESACTLVDGCLVCGDVAVRATVVEVGYPDALCEGEHGERAAVAVELVSPVSVGDALLVHGGVAISHAETVL